MFVCLSGVHPALGAEAAWWCQEEEEEVLHHPQEEQAQEEEGQARCAQILQGTSSGRCKVLVFQLKGNYSRFSCLTEAIQTFVTRVTLKKPFCTIELLR